MLKASGLKSREKVWARSAWHYINIPYVAPSEAINGWRLARVFATLAREMIISYNTLRCLGLGLLGYCYVASSCNAEISTASKVDQLFSTWDRPDSPGAAVAIIKNGAVVYQHGYGYANLEDRTPITPQTVFDVASVAKQFTGLAIAMLIERGKISLGDDVRKYLPEVPDFGKPIYIRHLLHHTSGLRDWPETLALAGVDMGSTITLETILEMVRRQRELDFPPGEEHLYSNTGYNLLAAAVAKVTGQSFRAWTEANLFEPLEMKHTGVCDNPGELVPNRAPSYSPAGQGKFQRVVSELAAQGSSSLFTTAEDMGKWLLNFEVGRVGGKGAVERMSQPGQLNSGKKVDYGFGVALGEYRGDSIITHGGSWAGYRSVVMRIPGKQFAVAILSNVGSMETERLVRAIADLYLDYAPQQKPARSPAKPRADAQTDPSTWEPFLGTYRLGPGWLLTIARGDKRLMAQATHEPKFEMTPLAANLFFVKAYGAEVEFVRTNSGPVTHLLYRGIHAPKLKMPESTPALLAAYVGDYWSDELRVAYRLEIRDGELGTRHRSGAWVRFLPTDADRFDTDPGGLAIAFTRNAAAEVAELKVSGGRMRNLRFSRISF
jgi:CubicO group peptidase (beta-lactamase class C family)